MTWVWWDARKSTLLGSRRARCRTYAEYADGIRRLAPLIFAARILDGSETHDLLSFDERRHSGDAEHGSTVLL